METREDCCPVGRCGGRRLTFDKQEIVRAAARCFHFASCTRCARQLSSLSASNGSLFILSLAQSLPRVLHSNPSSPSILSVRPRLAVSCVFQLPATAEVAEKDPEIWRLQIVRTEERVAMLRSCLRPLERCFGRIGSRDSLMWYMDLKPHVYGEFSIAVVQANDSLEDQGQVFTSPSATFVGVYDGHGGPEASRFVSNSLLPYLDRFASEQGGLSSEVIKRAFRATEEDFVRLVKRSWLSQPKIASVGTCCLVGAIARDMLYVANLGDSRVVLGRRSLDGKSVVAERLSTDHNVAVEEVRKEVVELHPDDNQIVVHARGAWRIKGIIQVSRAIGDIYLKKPEFSRDPLFQQFVSPLPLKRPVISAEPSIRIHKLKPHDLFLIFASDGLWEQLSDEAAAEIVSKNPRTGIAKRLAKAALSEAARKREMRYGDIKQIEKGIRRHFHDDITVIVIYLDQHRQGGHSKFNGNTNDYTRVPADIFSFNSDESEEPLCQHE